MSGQAIGKRPSGFLKFVFRVPVWMYSMRLGPLFFGRLITIVHRGRKSGKRYESGLEVIDRRGGELFVFAAWGTKSDWFRNIEANGVGELADGSHRSPATFRVVGADEAYGILTEYEQRHRTAAKFFFPGCWKATTSPTGRAVRSPSRASSLRFAR